MNQSALRLVAKEDGDKQRALEAALSQIDRAFGKGSVMKLGEKGKIVEIVELADHPWFVGVQFHPELKSKPFAPHPLFADFVRAALEQSRLV